MVKEIKHDEKTYRKRRVFYMERYARFLKRRGYSAIAYGDDVEWTAELFPCDSSLGMYGEPNYTDVDYLITVDMRKVETGSFITIKNIQYGCKAHELPNWIKKLKFKMENRIYYDEIQNDDIKVGE